MTHTDYLLSAILAVLVLDRLPHLLRSKWARIVSKRIGRVFKRAGWAWRNVRAWARKRK